MIERFVRLGLALALAGPAAAAGDSPAGWGGLQPGPHGVGFRLTTVLDQSRVYHGDPVFRGLPAGAETARAIRMYLWYPAASGGNALRVGDYVRMAAEDFDLVPAGSNMADDALPLPMQLAKGLDADKRRTLFAGPTAAFRDAPPAGGRFPLVILGQGLYFESPLALYTLAEFLASRGYVVATCPLLGTYSRIVNLTAADLETEVRDLEFVLARARELPFVDRDRMGLVGYDLGGMAGLLLAMRNPWIKAMATMDSGIMTPHFSGLPRSSPSYREDRFTIPWMMMLQARFEPAESGQGPTLLDRKDAGDSYYLLVDTENHGGYTSYAMLGIDREVPGYFGPVKGDPRIPAAGAYRAIASFFDGYLRGETAALEPLRRTERRPGSPDGIASIRFKPGMPAPVAEDEYVNDIIAHGTAEALPRVRTDMATGRVRIRESALRWVGLHFMLWWGRENEAVDVFRLLTELYPKSADAFDSLGEALVTVGENERGLASFRKSLQLNPKNANAERMIKRLEEKR